MPLDLAARCLRNALHGDYGGDLEPGMLVDQTADLAGRGQKLLHVRTVQHEDDELLRLRIAGTDTGSNHFSELQPWRVLRDRLEIVRVVVLTVDEDDLFRAARNIEIALVK